MAVSYVVKAYMIILRTVLIPKTLLLNNRLLLSLIVSIVYYFYVKPNLLPTIFSYYILVDITDMIRMFIILWNYCLLLLSTILSLLLTIIIELNTWSVYYTHLILHLSDISFLLQFHHTNQYRICYASILLVM